MAWRSDYSSRLIIQPFVVSQSVSANISWETHGTWLRTSKLATSRRSRRAFASSGRGSSSAKGRAPHVMPGSADDHRVARREMKCPAQRFVGLIRQPAWRHDSFHDDVASHPEIARTRRDVMPAVHTAPRAAIAWHCARVGHFSVPAVAGVTGTVAECGRHIDGGVADWHQRIMSSVACSATGAIAAVLAATLATTAAGTTAWQPPSASRRTSDLRS